MSLSDRLAALFSPSRTLAGAQPRAVSRGGRLGGDELLVPRAACHYRRSDFSALPKGNRHAAANLAAKRDYPDDDARHFIVWENGVAHTWVWVSPEPDFDADETHWLPESVLLAKPDSDGPRLLQLSTGFEGQVWEEGGLAASHYWPQPPDAAEWLRFLRSAGCGASQPGHAPRAHTVEFLPAPWGESSRQLPWPPARVERGSWVAAGCLVAVLLGWQIMALGVWSVAESRASQRVEALREESAPLLAAREDAQRALDELTDYVRLQTVRADYQLVADVVQGLPQDARIVTWRRDGDLLQVQVRSSETDPRVFVGAFHQDPVLADVSATPTTGEGQMQLDFRLRPAVGLAAAP